ncbi:hypothetical protein DENSPDRAFT_854328 [Dentipellis sp. KUC8613]|nr:hypothetical protein DENSPDRAFT_854328 [Dentipellis sp. KUC8613]
MLAGSTSKDFQNFEGAGHGTELDSEIIREGPDEPEDLLKHAPHHCDVRLISLQGALDVAIHRNAACGTNQCPATMTPLRHQRMAPELAMHDAQETDPTRSENDHKLHGIVESNRMARQFALFQQTSHKTRPEPKSARPSCRDRRRGAKPGGRDASQPRSFRHKDYSRTAFQKPDSLGWMRTSGRSHEYRCQLVSGEISFEQDTLLTKREVT